MSGCSDGTPAAFDFVFEVDGIGSQAVEIVFLKVPQMAVDAIGAIRVDWGDGHSDTPDILLNDLELETMASDSGFTAKSVLRHLYALRTPTRIHIQVPNGILPLSALPRETKRIFTSLPTLTLGETSAHGDLIASPVAPTLVPTNSEGQSNLEKIPDDLFRHNPQFCVFDETFIGTSIQKLPAALFSYIDQIVSMRRTFLGSALLEIEAGALQHTNTSSVLQETFADCLELEAIGDVFSGQPIPVCVDEMFRGANPMLFAWCEPSRRKAMGWIRPRATLADPYFAFEWKAAEPEKPETVLAFYPIDLALDGDFCIEWGDGSDESFDWNTQDTVSHAWSDTKVHRVKVHYTKNEPVRPFRLGENVTRILSPLPRLHPRCVDDLGDFCGWAADSRNLIEIPKQFFANNPDIVNLEQAFAGCCRLRNVPDDVLTPLSRLRHLDSMFAFCKSLPALPASYAGHERNIAMDYFVAEEETH